MQFSKLTSLALLAQLAVCAPVVHIVTKTIETTVIVTVGQTQALGTAVAVAPVTLSSSSSTTTTSSSTPITSSSSTTTSDPAPAENVVTVSIDATGGAHTLYPTTSSTPTTLSTVVTSTPVPAPAPITTSSTTSTTPVTTAVESPTLVAAAVAEDTTSSTPAAAPVTTEAPATTVAATSIEAPTTTSSSSTSTTSTSTSATAAATTSSSSDLSSFASAILSEHNIKRALHGVSALTWDDTLASYASNYADEYDCSGTLTHSGGPYGENLALGYSETGAVDAWYAEGDDYDYSAADVLDHFTQVVWKSTTKVGCAVKYCSSYWGSYIVCEYDPVGNIIGEETANVLPLV